LVKPSDLTKNVVPMTSEIMAIASNK